VAAGHANVFVHCRIAIDGGFLRRHHTVGERVKTAHRDRRNFFLAQLAHTWLHRVRCRTQRMGDQPVQGLHHRRRLAAFGIDADRAAQRDQHAHTLRRLMRTVQPEHAAQAPAHQAYLTPALVVQVADFLFQSRRVFVLEAQIAPQAPGVNVIAAIAEKQLQCHQRDLACHEARQQQHRVAVTLRRTQQQWQRVRQGGHFQQGAELGGRMQRMGCVLMGVPGSHGQ